MTWYVWLKPLCTPRSWRLYSWFPGLCVSEFRKPSKSLSRTCQLRESPRVTSQGVDISWNIINSGGFMMVYVDCLPEKIQGFPNGRQKKKCVKKRFWWISHCDVWWHIRGYIPTTFPREKLPIKRTSLVDSCLSPHSQKDWDILVGGFSPLLWKMMEFVSWNDEIPNIYIYIWKNNHQPGLDWLSR